MGICDRWIRMGICLVLGLSLFFAVGTARTASNDVAALQAFKKNVQDSRNFLSSWTGNDPCGNGTGTSWNGVYCKADSNGTYHVTELRLLRRGLVGPLAPELGNLTSLEVLDVMWNNISGSIPSSIGRLQNLTLLLVNGNNLTGELPSELGNLQNLDRIQIDENKISGPIPSTFGNLVKVKHFHMNNNSLSGSIPKELGKLPKIVHILFDNNNLTGTLPTELANLSKTLLILQLDNNNFSGANIPSEYQKLTKLLKLSLRNCSLEGTVPDLSNISQLGYLDLAYNKLSGKIPTTKLSSNITSIDLSNNRLTGNLPSSFSDLPNLHSLILQKNNLTGNISGNLGSGNESSKVVLDFQYNNFSIVAETLISKVSSNSNFSMWLYGNPYCNNHANSTVCNGSNTEAAIVRADSGSSNNISQCNSNTCNSNTDEPVRKAKTCICRSPATVNYRLKSPGFKFFDRYRDEFESYISRGLSLDSTQIYIDSYVWQPGPRLRMDIKIFYLDASQSFLSWNSNITELKRVYDMFAGWKIPDSDTFGPYEFNNFTIPKDIDSNEWYNIIGKSSKKGLTVGAVIGIAAGVIIFTGIVVVVLLVWLLLPKRRLANRRLQQRRKDSYLPIKVAGVRAFSYEELEKATDSFNIRKEIGEGGYGKVYKAVIENDQVVAIKRAGTDSMQGGKEFYTEIELLSRVHHRNLVSLIGYCNDGIEQMLVYEYIGGGTLRENLSSTSSSLTFPARLRIALGSAKGILYLHTEANPPIFHRDIKASNILLDDRGNAKVADFGLSRLAPVPDAQGAAPGHVSTIVKGTPGYLDPEYFLTRQLTDKSDVYSFGVVMLELLTSMPPISEGKNMVREVKTAYGSGKISVLLDGSMGPYPAEAMDLFIKLALSCVESNPDDRPSMAEVVRSLEDILNSTPWADSSTNNLDTPANESKFINSPYREEEPMISKGHPSQPDSGLFSHAMIDIAPR